MNAQVQRDYLRFRQSGMRATAAYRAVKIHRQFERLERAGLVEIALEHEEENYFDVYGEPDSQKDREQIERSIEIYGNYCVIGQYRLQNEGEFDHADSVGMCAGYHNAASPYENWYVVDIMAATIAALVDALKSRCACCRKAA